MSELETKFNAWRAGKEFVCSAAPRQSPPFAPGVITRHTRSTALQRRALVRWLRRAVMTMALAGAAGLLAGLVTGARAAEAVDQDKRPALLPTTVGLHLHSVHLGDQGRNWNNANRGLYARWSNGLTVGAVRNSLDRTGFYAGWTGERALGSVGGLPVSAAITLGATTGYDRLVQDAFTGQPGRGQHTATRCDATGRCRTVLLREVVTPLVVPSVAMHISPRAAVRLSFIPKVGADADHALHLAIEWKLP